MASPGRSYYSLLFVSDTLAQKGGLDSECLEGIGGLSVAYALCIYNIQVGVP